MPKNSPSDDITFTTIGQLFEEMHIGMNPKPSLLLKDTGNDDGTTTNLKDCPTPKFYAISPIKYGYLTKQGHNFRSWKKRLCCIEGNYLYYYANEDDVMPRGVIFLPKCIVQEEPAIGKEHKTNCFSIRSYRSWNVNNTRFYSDRTFYFCLASSIELGDWIAIIQTISTGLPRYATLDLF